MISRFLIEKNNRKFVAKVVKGLNCHCLVGFD